MRRLRSLQIRLRIAIRPILTIASTPMKIAATAASVWYLCAIPVKKSSAQIAIRTRNNLSIQPSRPQLTSSSLFIPVTPD